MRSLTCSVLFATILARAYAAIGPVADLVIANRDISPDGFLRTLVTCSSLSFRLSPTRISPVVPPLQMVPCLAH
jgi:hypothetical protein